MTKLGLGSLVFKALGAFLLVCTGLYVMGWILKPVLANYPSIPIPPRAQQLQREFLDGPMNESLVITFVSDDTESYIRRFYSDALLQQGWNSGPEYSDGWSLYLTKSPFSLKDEYQTLGNGATAVRIQIIEGFPNSHNPFPYPELSP